MIDLEAIRARVKAATPGPWEEEFESCDCGDGYPCGHGNWVYAIRMTTPSDELEGNHEKHWSHCYERSEICEFSNTDADFIAHSRTDVPYLLDIVDSLTKERDQLKSNFESVADLYEDEKVQLARLRAVIEEAREFARVRVDDDCDWDFVTSMLDRGLKGAGDE